MTVAILDIIVVAVVLLSALLAMIRGFSREVLSVGSWAAAGAAGAAVYLYEEPLTPFVQTYVNNELIATIAAVGIAFLVTLIVVSFITMRISDFIIDSSIGALDRTIGFIFGAARGVLLVVIAMAFFNWFQPENQPEWIADAKSKPFIDQMVISLQNALPEDVEDLVSQGKERILGEEENTLQADENPNTPAINNQDRRGLDNLLQSETNQ